MKKIFLVWLVMLFLINLTSCVQPASPTGITPEASEIPTLNPTPVFKEEAESIPKVNFIDPVFEALVRATIGKPIGDISVAEAQTMTRLDLSNEWQKYFSSNKEISDITGLENFSNLESLDLSYQSISDISPLQKLTKLTFLSLAGNPISDFWPLSVLTNLKTLILSECKAQDYSPLAKLSIVETLLLDGSTISDVSPLASLTKLKHLYLANSPVTDLFVLSDIYSNLEEKDFILPSTLQELGFVMDYNAKQARFESDQASIVINHTSWGQPEWEWERDIIRTSMYLNDEYKVAIGFYGDIDAYVIQMVTDGNMEVNYIYDANTGDFTIGEGDRQSTENIIRTVFDTIEGEDVLLAPLPVFENVIRQAFHMTPEMLFELPFEPISLKSLGFFAEKENAVCLYEQRGEWDYNLEIHRPEWGEKDFDVRFFTPISNEYRIVATYHAANNQIRYSVDDNNMGGAAFNYFLDTKEYVDEWCSYEDLSVEQYFMQAFDDPEIEDVYLYSVDLMTQYFIDRFGMTYQDLFALPGCE